MSGLYIHVENPISSTPAKLEKQRIPPMTSFMRREGLALALPFNRRESDHRYAHKKVETIAIPLKLATFDPLQVDREKRVMETGSVSILNWLARLAMAGFRVHNSAGEAQAAQNAATHQRTVDAVVGRFADYGYSKIGADELIAYLTKVPRGNNSAFDADTMATVVRKYLNLGKDPQGMAAAIAAHLAANSDGWGKQANNPVTPQLRTDALLGVLDHPVTASALIALIETTVPESLVEFGVQKTSLSCFPPEIETQTLVSAMSAGEGALETGLSAAAHRLGDPSEAVAALISDGPTFNGLSWLLNPKKGLGMWAAAEPSDIARHFGCPVPVVEKLQSDARGILKDYSGAFGQLHELRNQIGGGVSGFGDRYFTRLGELKQSIEHVRGLFESVVFPETLMNESSDRAFWGTGFTADSLKGNWEVVVQGLPDLAHSLDVLQGVADEAPTQETLFRVEAGFDRIRALFGQLRLVLNNIRVWRQDIEAATRKGNLETARLNEVAFTRLCIPDLLVSAIGFKDWVSQETSEEHEVLKEPGTPKTVKPEPIDLPLMVRRRSRQDRIEDLLAERTGQLSDAVRLATTLTDDLLNHEALPDALLSVFFRQDKRHYANRGEAVDDRFLAVQGRRHVLDEWFRFWASLSRTSADYAQAELVGLNLGYSDDPDNIDDKSASWRYKAHAFIQEGKGCLWKSIFAKGRQKPFGLNSERLLAVDLNALIRRMTDWLTTQYQMGAFDAVSVDYHALCAKRLEMASRITDQALPTDHPALMGWPLPVTFRPAEQARLEQHEPLSGRDVARVMGRLAVSMRDAASFLHRHRHLDRAAFKPVKALEKLAYVCKRKDAEGQPRYWCPPERLWVAQTPAGSLLRSLIDERAPVSVGGLFDQIKSLSKKAAPADLWAARQLLKEMPHTWAIATDLSGLQGGADLPVSDVVMIGKEGIDSAPKKARVYPMNLTPVRSNLLDECLAGERKHMPGNLTLHYSYPRSNGYRPTVDRVEAHIPTEKVAAPSEDKANSPYLDRLIGIDLGERGIGFSVREIGVKGDPLVARGTVPVPAIRTLIQATRKFRQRHQKAMSVRASHVNFEEMRKAVAGNVISAIKYLMWHYQGLPVLEQDVGNLDSGQRQLSHVYKAITRYFLNDPKSTHLKLTAADQARKNSWRGFKIEHPYRQRVFTDPKNGATSVKSFNLFPGTGVRAANTSKTCSGCGVNPIKALRDHKGDRLPLDERGCVTLDSGDTLQFYKARSINLVIKGEGAPEPISNRIMEKAQLISHLNNAQLRVRPASKQSKDTSQSRYWCANVNCEHHDPDQMLHADMNAADNIVMRKCRSLVWANGE